MAKDRIKLASRIASAVAVVLILSVGAAAFSFISSPIRSTVPVNPPSGNLIVTGSWPSSYTINGTKVSSFSVKDGSDTNIVFSVNVTIAMAGMQLGDVTLLIAGVSANQGCNAGSCWWTSAGTWPLEPQQSIVIDVSVTPHTLGSMDLSFVARGSGG